MIILVKCFFFPPDSFPGAVPPTSRLLLPTERHSLKQMKEDVANVSLTKDMWAGSYCSSCPGWNGVKLSLKSNVCI